MTIECLNAISVLSLTVYAARRRLVYGFAPRVHLFTRQKTLKKILADQNIEAMVQALPDTKLLLTCILQTTCTLLHNQNTQLFSPGVAT